MACQVYKLWLVTNIRELALVFVPGKPFLKTATALGMLEWPARYIHSILLWTFVNQLVPSSLVSLS